MALAQIAAQQLAGVTAPSAPPAGAAVGGAPDDAVERKRREVYVGNLAIGSITGQHLEEFFNQALAHLVPDPVAAPPVASVNFDAQGRFAFVELRSRALATHACTMDKLVEVLGRNMHIGRPKGYTDPYGAPEPGADGDGGGLGAAPPPPALPPPGGPPPAAAAGPPPSRAVLLSNVLPVGELRDAATRADLAAAVEEEAGRHGGVAAVAVPPPPPGAQDRAPGRAYVLFAVPADAARALAVFHGRALDGRPLRAAAATEAEFSLAAAGEWTTRHRSVAGVPLPGLYALTPLQGGVQGLTALNPALAALVQANPGLAASLAKGVDRDEVPFEEGWVKLRGYAPGTTRAHVAEFFAPAAGGAPVPDADIRLVSAVDGTPLGEAFVHLRGPEAKLRLALARDRQPLPPAGAAAEVLTSSEDDLHRRIASGCLVE